MLMTQISVSSQFRKSFRKNKSGYILAALINSHHEIKQSHRKNDSISKKRVNHIDPENVRHMFAVLL